MDKPQSEFEKVKFKQVKEVADYFDWDVGTEQYNELLSMCDWTYEWCEQNMVVEKQTKIGKLIVACGETYEELTEMRSKVIGLSEAIIGYSTEGDIHWILEEALRDFGIKEGDDNGK